jgi:hypothetical protein
MTSYTAIANGDIDQDSPVTQPLVTALRDNPIAIGEADSSVPAGLLPTVLLGTLTTTSGSTQTLSGLDLTPYKFVYAVFDGVSADITGGNLTFAGLATAVSAVGSATIRGFFNIDLSDGTATWALVNIGGSVGNTSAATFNVGTTSLTNASTSVSVSTASGSFDAGSIRIYGMK